MCQHLLDRLDQTTSLQTVSSFITKHREGPSYPTSLYFLPSCWDFYGLVLDFCAAVICAEYISSMYMQVDHSERWAIFPAMLLFHRHEFSNGLWWYIKWWPFLRSFLASLSRRMQAGSLNGPRSLKLISDWCLVTFGNQMLSVQDFFFKWSESYSNMTGRVWVCSLFVSRRGGRL